MTIPVFPNFHADEIDWRPIGGSLNSVGIDGIPQTINISGGPYWRLRLNGITLVGENEILTARAIQADLDNGATVYEVPAYECWFRPVPDGYIGGAVPHSDGTPFSDDTLYLGAPVDATVSTAIARRSGLFYANITSGQIKGGEHFSVDHPNQGRRMYRVVRLESGNGTGSCSFKIRPLLREALSGGEVIDFNRPSCLMTLVGGFDIPSGQGITAQTDAEFAEFMGDINPAPSIVEEFTVEDTGAGQATIEWRNPYRNFYSYEVWRGASGSAFADATLINGPTHHNPGALVSLNHAGLSGTYRWWVVAKSLAGDFRAPPFVQAAIT